MPAITASGPSRVLDWKDVALDTVTSLLIDMELEQATTRELFLQTLGLWQADRASQANTKLLLLEQVAGLKAEIVSLRATVQAMRAR